MTLFAHHLIVNPYQHIVNHARRHEDTNVDFLILRLSVCIEHESSDLQLLVKI